MEVQAEGDTTIDHLGFRLSGGQDERHVGLLYRSPLTGELRQLDLYYHYTLMDRGARLDGVCGASGLDEVNAQLIAGFCRLVAESNANGKVPYGLEYEGQIFDPVTGKWLLDQQGLTCATFVMAVFESQSLPVLVWSEWPRRDDDAAWHEIILADLSRSRAVSEAYLDSQREKRGCARFRPEEVAAGIESETPPLPFAVAEKRGRELVDELP